MIAPDMATMLAYRLHRRADRRPGPAGDAGQSRCQELQRHHHRQRHLDLRHADAVRHRRCRAARRAKDRRAPPTAASPRSSGARRSAPRSCPSGGARRRRMPEIRRDHGRGRGESPPRPSASPSRSPIRRSSRPRSPARTPIGAASSRPSARPARRPTATGSRSGSATSASPTRACAIRAYDEAAVSALMKEEKIDDPRRYRCRRRRPRDGLDLRPHQGICRHQRRLSELKCTW